MAGGGHDALSVPSPKQHRLFYCQVSWERETFTTLGLCLPNQSGKICFVSDTIYINLTGHPTKQYC